MPEKREDEVKREEQQTDRQREAAEEESTPRYDEEHEGGIGQGPLL
jgi:hypothetical protein